jgi:hypothetical protein
MDSVRLNIRNFENNIFKLYHCDSRNDMRCRVRIVINVVTSVNVDYCLVSFIICFVVYVKVEGKVRD